MLHRQIVQKPPQVLLHVACVLVAAFRIGIQALGHQGIQAPGYLGAATAQTRVLGGGGDPLSCSVVVAAGVRPAGGSGNGWLPLIISNRIRPSA